MMYESEPSAMGGPMAVVTAIDPSPGQLEQPYLASDHHYYGAHAFAPDEGQQPYLHHSPVLEPAYHQHHHTPPLHHQIPHSSSSSSIEQHSAPYAMHPLHAQVASAAHGGAGMVDVGTSRPSIWPISGPLDLHSAYSYQSHSSALEEGPYGTESMSGSFSSHVTEPPLHVAVSSASNAGMVPGTGSPLQLPRQPPFHPPQASPLSSSTPHLPTLPEEGGPASQPRPKRARKRKTSSVPAAGPTPTGTETDGLDSSPVIPEGSLPDVVLSFSDFVADLSRASDSAAAEDAPLNYERYLDVPNLMAEVAKGNTSAGNLKRQKKRVMKYVDEGREAAPLEKAYAIRDTVHDALGILFIIKEQRKDAGKIFTQSFRYHCSQAHDKKRSNDARKSRRRRAAAEAGPSTDPPSNLFPPQPNGAFQPDESSMPPPSAWGDAPLSSSSADAPPSLPIPGPSHSSSTDSGVLTSGAAEDSKSQPVKPAAPKPAKGHTGRYEAQGEGCHGRLTIGLLPTFAASGRIYHLAKVGIRHDIQHVKPSDDSTATAAAGDDDDDVDETIVMADGEVDPDDTDVATRKLHMMFESGYTTFPDFPGASKPPYHPGVTNGRSQAYSADGIPPSSTGPASGSYYPASSYPDGSASLIPFEFPSSQLSSGQYPSQQGHEHHTIGGSHPLTKDVAQETRLLDSTSIVAAFVHTRIIQGLPKDLADRIEHALQPMLALVGQIDPAHFEKVAAKMSIAQHLDGMNGSKQWDDG